MPCQKPTFCLWHVSLRDHRNLMLGLKMETVCYCEFKTRSNIAKYDRDATGGEACVKCYTKMSTLYSNIISI